jgi:hypothetical protein
VLFAFSLALLIFALSLASLSWSRMSAKADLITPARWLSGISSAAEKKAWATVFVPRGARFGALVFLAIGLLLLNHWTCEQTSKSCRFA